MKFSYLVGGNRHYSGSCVSLGTVPFNSTGWFFLWPWVVPSYGGSEYCSSIFYRSLGISFSCRSLFSSTLSWDICLPSSTQTLRSFLLNAESVLGSLVFSLLVPQPEISLKAGNCGSNRAYLVDSPSPRSHCTLLLDFHCLGNFFIFYIFCFLIIWVWRVNLMLPAFSS